MNLFESEHNIYPPWNDEYIAYNAILEGLTAICDGGHWTENDEKEFESAIRVEAGKVNIFITRKQRDLETRFVYCKRALARARAETEDAPIWRSTSNIAKEIMMELAELNRYVRVNYNALECLIDEHTKRTEINQRSLLVEICRDRRIDNQRFDDLFVEVCSLSEALEGQNLGADKLNTKQKQSISARFWVHTDNIAEVKAMLLFHMPMQVITPDKYFEQSTHSRTIIYLDNDEFQQYTSQLQFDDGAELISISWCNDIEATDCVSVYRSVLKKTEDGALPKSDQISLPKSRISDFLSLKYSIESLTQDLQAEHRPKEYIDISCATALSIQQTIKNQRLVPKVQAQMDRLLFLSPEDPAFSLSLHTDVTFTKLDGVEMERRKWFQQGSISKAPSTPFREGSESESYMFPHAILEVQFDIGRDDKLPLWLAEFLNSKLIYEVPRFTMFAQGVAQSWRSQLPILPWWLMHLEFNFRRTRQDKQNIKGAKEGNCIAPSYKYHDGVGFLETCLRRKLILPSKTHTTMLRSVTNSSTKRAESITYTQTDRAKSISCSSSTYNIPPLSSSISDLRSRQSVKDGNNQQSTFLDYYYDGRNENSQAYILQRVETVKEDDQLRQQTIIQMEEEEKRLKKEKKKEKKKKKGQTLEPKIFFANERVFLKYLQFAALIMSAALTLLNFGDYISTIAGATFFGISTVIAIYSTFRYRLRSYQIKTFPSLRYDDRYGPVGLCALLIGAMVLNFVLRWEHPSATDTYLGTSNQTKQQSNQQP